MKKFAALALALIMILSCTACGGKKEKDRLAQIKEKGYIEIATEPYFAPYEFIDPNKSGDEQYVGFDIEVMKVIADEIGVDLKIVPLDFTAVLSGVTEGKYDLAISAIAYSPSREEAMNLSKGYYFSKNEGYGLVCRTEDADKFNSVESLKDAVVTTQSGSVQEGIYNEYVGKDGCKELKLFANMTDCYLAVAENKADVCICSRSSAKLYAEANGGLTVTEFKFETSPEMSSNRIGAPKEGTESLMEVVNKVIDKLIETDQINQWHDEYEEYAKSLGL